MIWLRVLGFVVMALGGLLSLSQCQVKSLKSDNAQIEQQLSKSQADLMRAVDINKSNNAIINRLNDSLVLQEQLTAEQINRASTLTRELNDAQKQLQEQADYDQKLREYLASNIYYAVVEWLWLKPGKGGGGEKGTGASVATRQFAPANTKAGFAIPVVTHQKGWAWAKATDRALDDCNADKAALRKWVAHQKALLPSANQAATE